MNDELKDWLMDKFYYWAITKCPYCTINPALKVYVLCEKTHRGCTCDESSECYKEFYDIIEDEYDL